MNDKDAKLLSEAYQKINEDKYSDMKAAGNFSYPPEAQEGATLQLSDEEKIAVSFALQTVWDQMKIEDPDDQMFQGLTAGRIIELLEDVERRLVPEEF